MRPLRRISLFDLVFLIAFLAVAGWMAAISVPKPLPDPNAALTAQMVLIERADEAKKRIDLVPPPTPREEAAAMLAALRRCFDGDKLVRWDDFRVWIGRRGKPETITGFEKVWGDYRQAADAFEKEVASLAAAPQEPDPVVELKQADMYFTLYNRFEAADGALYGWVAGLSAIDFK